MLSNGYTVGIVEVQSSNMYGNTIRQSTIGCLGHVAQPQNNIVMGVLLSKTYYMQILAIRAEVVSEGDKKLAEIVGITEAYSLLDITSLRILINYFCEAVKKVCPDPQETQSITVTDNESISSEPIVSATPSICE